MNIMAQAHKMVKALIAKLSPSARYKGQYANMLSVALKQAHKEYKAMQKSLGVANTFRNLYKVWSGEKLVAFVTASSPEGANVVYKRNGGKITNPIIERVSFGYHMDMCEVYE